MLSSDLPSMPNIYVEHEFHVKTFKMLIFSKELQLFNSLKRSSLNFQRTYGLERKNWHAHNFQILPKFLFVSAWIIKIQSNLEIDELIIEEFYDWSWCKNVSIGILLEYSKFKIKSEAENWVCQSEKSLSSCKPILKGNPNNQQFLKKSEDKEKSAKDVISSIRLFKDKSARRKCL